MSARGRLAMIVNFFAGHCDTESRDLLVASSGVSLRLLGLSRAVSRRILVDGTAEPCEPMRALCAELGVSYLHAGRGIGYVEAYNLGWRSSDCEFVGLMANDVLPYPPASVDRLAEWIARPDVGCVFPYLVSARRPWDETQRPRFLSRGNLTCEPASMTLNLNIFKRNVLEQIGGLDESFVFGYQEPLLLIKIRSCGYRVVMVGETVALHYDRLNKTTGASNLTADKMKSDRRRWFEQYPSFAFKGGIGDLRLWKRPFATSRPLQALWWLGQHVRGSRLRRWSQELAMGAEPWLCRYPAPWGRAAVSKPDRIPQTTGASETHFAEAVRESAGQS